MGHNGFYSDREVSSFLGVNNLFDEEYNSNIRINAIDGRYLVPAPDQNGHIKILLLYKLNVVKSSVH